MRRIFYCLVLAAFSCESAPEKPTDPDQVKSDSQLRSKPFVATATTLRDRPFSGDVPSLVPQVPYVAKSDDGIALARDRKAIETVFFNGQPIFETSSLERFAHYDGSSNTVVYDGSRSTDLLKEDIVAAYVNALDSQQRNRTMITSVDELLADRALSHAASSVVENLQAVRRQNADIKLQTFVAQPEIAATQSEQQKRFLNSEYRAGFTFATAMIRAGGWAGHEMALADPPRSMGHVLRPDRWLNGDSLGNWEWADGGSKLPQVASGRIGPGVLAIFVSKAFGELSGARLHNSWMSDAYRFRQNDKGWHFEYASMWNTPSDANYIAAALREGLPKVVGKKPFTVVVNQNVVAIVGASDAAFATPARAIVTSEMSPKFQVEDRKWLKYVPTLHDRLRKAAKKSKWSPNEYIDLETSVALNPSSVGPEWQLSKTEDWRVRWFAQNGTSVIQMTIEPLSPLLPSFSDDGYVDAWSGAFAKSMTDFKELSRTRRTEPFGDVAEIQATGRVEGESKPTRLRAFQIDRGPFVVTISVQGRVASSKTDDLAFDALLKTVDATSAVKSASKTDTGIVEFSVE